MHEITADISGIVLTCLLKMALGSQWLDKDYS
jgi:hypothetical protein